MNVVRLREGTASELLPESPFRFGQATQRLRRWSRHGDGVKTYSLFIITGLREKVGRSARTDADVSVKRRRGRSFGVLKASAIKQSRL